MIKIFGTWQRFGQAALLSAIGGMAMFPAASEAGILPAGWTCTADVITAADACGSGPTNGVVTSSPLGGDYEWISTNGGTEIGTVGQLAGVGGFDGTELNTSSFAVNAGAMLSFYFNYVTSDGAGFSDYAWARLMNGSTQVALLFTARTVVSPGNTSPGFSLGLNDSALNPLTTAINPGGPNWSQLGADSGKCYVTGGSNPTTPLTSGCGYTGWINSLYTIKDAGTYFIQFGVTNFLDGNFDSGLAIDGVTIDGTPINPVPEPSMIGLMAMSLLSLFGFGMLRRRREV